MAPQAPQRGDASPHPCHRHGFPDWPGRPCWNSPSYFRGTATTSQPEGAAAQGARDSPAWALTPSSSGRLPGQRGRGCRGDQLGPPQLSQSRWTGCPGTLTAAVRGHAPSTGPRQRQRSHSVITFPMMLPTSCRKKSQRGDVTQQKEEMPSMSCVRKGQLAGQEERAEASSVPRWPRPSPAQPLTDSQHNKDTGASPGGHHWPPQGPHKRQGKSWQLQIKELTLSPHRRTRTH